MQPRRTVVIISAVVLAGGVVAMTLGGVPILRDPSAVSVLAWPVYVLGHAIATMSLVILIGALTGPGVTADGDRSTVGDSGGVHSQARIRFAGSEAGLLPVIIFGVSAMILLVLTVLLRDGLPSSTWTLFGVIAAFMIGYWGFRAFRGYRSRRGNATH